MSTWEGINILDADSSRFLQEDNQEHASISLGIFKIE